MLKRKRETTPQILPSRPVRIETLRVANYRALREVALKNITPLTVLLGPNGSGKSTVFDVFSFLSECFQFGLHHAWHSRGRGRELKTRGQSGPIVIEIQSREGPKQPLITYHLAIDEKVKAPIVVEEWLQWRNRAGGRIFRFLEYREGKGGALGAKCLTKGTSGWPYLCVPRTS